MEIWVYYTILHAVFLAFFEASKKKASEKNSIYVVLASFSLIGFIITAIITEDALMLDYNYLPVILLKSSVVAVAWILGLTALKQMEISLYSMIRISTIIITVILSSIVLGEVITIKSLIGMIIVVLGLILVNKGSHEEGSKNNSMKPILILLVSCIFNSISAIIDKKVLSHVNSGQLQFWFLLFLSIYFWLFVIIRREKIDFKIVKKNYWIPLAAISIVTSDRLLFKANQIESSQVIVITMLNQLSVIISIILGKVLFGEKNIIKKLLYSLLIICGIGVMFI